MREMKDRAIKILRNTDKIKLEGKDVCEVGRREEAAIRR